MRRSLFAWFVLQSTSCLFAQDATPSPDALAAGKQRLVAALQKTAATNDVAFTTSWGANNKKKDGDNDQVLGMFGQPVSGKASGSWHDGLQHVVFEGGNDDEIWRTGGRAVARDKNREWCTRKNRFADGNSLPYAADPAELLRQLATMDLAVVQRTPGSIDDRPVEIVTVTLNPDQVTELLRGEHVPDPLLQNPMAAFQIAFGGGGAQQRPEAQKPQATVDIAIAFDPGTSLVQELRFRSWMKDEGNGRNFVVRGGGAGAVRVIGGNAQNDDDDADEKDKDAATAPMQLDNGLPVRPRKKMLVMDFSVRLSEHGTKKAPEIDDAAKKLLQR